MTKKERTRFIIDWNIKYPYDKRWRVKYSQPLFSKAHKEMCLVDILMDSEEDNLYREAAEGEKSKIPEEEKSLRDREYIRGQGNFLSVQEDSLSEEQLESLFDNIKI